MKPKQVRILGCFLALTLLLAIFQGCKKDQNDLDDVVKTNDLTTTEALITGPSNQVMDRDEMPAATVSLIDYPKPIASITTRSTCTEVLTPASMEATLRPGQTCTETKTACISGAPPKGDIMFSMDLTGSMGGELANVKVNSVNIMDEVMSLFATGETRFGLISHMDYCDYYSSCGYSGTYGYAPSGDYPYQLDKALTATSSEVTTAINGLVMGNGVDIPENYARVFYETYSDPNIVWRADAAKIVVAWLDASPHDCDWTPTVSTGGDPGRDCIMGTSDDLDFDAVIQGMKDNNIKLIVLCSGGPGLTALWKTEAEKTGGSAVEINSDGTIPGGTDIAEFIKDRIWEAVKHVNTLTLEPEPAFASWLTGCNPACYTDILLDCDKEFTYTDVTFKVPEGTPSGTYEFDLNLMGDGHVYGSQTVTIHVLNEIEVPVDIHPGSCPNPLNSKSKGKIPVSICGTPDFDVSQINVSTVRLAGVAPVWNNLGDDSTPFMPFINKPLNQYSCNTAGPDGITDLKLKFETSDVMNAIGPVSQGQILRLILTGTLNNGTPFIGEDIVKIAN